MKILNAYSGLGGNRKYWGTEHDITAIENNEDIAKIYQEYFPNDKVIIADAHEYLEKHFKEYDFIWASPPCPTHSRLNSSIPKEWKDKYNTMQPRYPDMKLYEEIILLKYFAPKNCKWVIENVIPYYDYLIEPNIILGRHPFWCNFNIEQNNFKDKRRHKNITGKETIYGFNLENKKISKGYDKRKILRNLVNPEIGKYILDQVLNIVNYKQLNLF